MKYTKYILSLMFLASLNGCIKEDMSDCPGNCTLKFSYVGDGTTQIFQDKIHKVDMYVFDSDGMLLSSHPISEADVKKQSTELNLPVGDYQIVTVGNTYNTEVSGEQNLATAQFCDEDCIHGERIAGNDSLYYAYKEISIPGDAKQTEEKNGFCQFALQSPCRGDRSRFRRTYHTCSGMAYTEHERAVFHDKLQQQCLWQHCYLLSGN